MRRISGFVFAGLLIFSAAFTARAGQYDIKEMTPAIQQALESRKARYAELRRLKSEGAIGEDNQGFVKALAEEPAVDELTQAENSDRRVIYAAIVEQHRLGAEGMTQVKAAFAAVQREKAQPGDSVQLPSGEWIKK